MDCCGGKANVGVRAARKRHWMLRSDELAKLVEQPIEKTSVCPAEIIDHNHRATTIAAAATAGKADSASQQKSRNVFTPTNGACQRARHKNGSTMLHEEQREERKLLFPPAASNGTTAIEASTMRIKLE